MQRNGIPIKARDAAPCQAIKIVDGNGNRFIPGQPKIKGNFL
jgi:hypothetical protein